MAFFSTLFGLFGFGFGVAAGLLIGYFLFIYWQPSDVKDPIVRPLGELDSKTLQSLLPEIPLWVKNPDYDRVDWLNRFVRDLWPYLDKAICKIIKETTQPLIKQYSEKFKIDSVEFKCLTLGTLPPTLQGKQSIWCTTMANGPMDLVRLADHDHWLRADQTANTSGTGMGLSSLYWMCGYAEATTAPSGVKAFDTQESEMIIEPAVKWAGNPNILVEVKAFGLKATVQLVDLQVFAVARFTFKPLVPSFPCFSKIVVSLMDKPHIDFGLKLLGGDLMAIPGLYGFVQDLIKEEIAKLYLWPKTLEIAILDDSKAAVKKPVGMLQVKILNARNLRKADVMGKSDPYVKISLGDKTLWRKTQVKKNTLNPDWNETHTLVVQDPNAQVLELHVYDWEKVSSHDKLGMAVVPLASLVPEEPKVVTLDLRKNMDDNDPSNQKPRGQLTAEVLYKPFKEDEVPDETEEEKAPEGTPQGGGLLVVIVHKADDLEGKHHTNPYAKVVYKGQEYKTKPLKKTRDPRWPDGKFEIVCEEPPLNDKIRIEIMSKSSVIALHLKELLGYVEINLGDVVRNKRINEEYVLIDSKNGKVHVELQWLPS